MSDVREAFEAVTAPPRSGARERQARRQRRAVRRRRGGALVVTVAIAVGIGLLTFNGSRRDGGTPQIADDATSSPGAPEDDAFLLAISDGTLTPFRSPVDGWSYRYSPDGSQVAFVALEWDTDQQIFVMNADGTGMATVTGTGFAYEWATDVDDPAWSPDGRWLVFGGTDVTQGAVNGNGRGLYFISPEGEGAPRSAVGFLSSAQGDPSWSPDGRRIAFTATGDDGPEVRIVRTAPREGGTSITADGAAETLLEGASSPSWSPDGTRLVFVESDSGRVSIADADGTGVRAIAETSSAAPSWSPDGASIAYDDLSRGRIAVYDVSTSETTYLDADACMQGWADAGSLLVTTACER
jgi:Tol biopolymer transport system component